MMEQLCLPVNVQEGTRVPAVRKVLAPSPSSLPRAVHCISSTKVLRLPLPTCGRSRTTPCSTESAIPAATAAKRPMEDQHGWYREHIPDLYQCRWAELQSGLEPVYPVSLVEFLTRQQHVRARAGNCSERECDEYPVLRLTQWR